MRQRPKFREYRHFCFRNGKLYGEPARIASTEILNRNDTQTRRAVSAHDTGMNILPYILSSSIP